MEANGRPNTPGRHDFFVVQSQNLYGGAPTGSCANNIDSILAPRELFGPDLFSWVKESNKLLGHWVNCFGPVFFILIATMAG